MKFCKYCGKQLQDNEMCDCEGAVAARREAEQPTPEPVKQEQTTASQTAEQAAAAAAQAAQALNKGFQSAMSAVQSSDAAMGAKDVLLRMIKKPISTLEEVYAEGNKGPQFLLGVFYILGLLLFPTTAFLKTQLPSFGEAFATAFMFLILCLLLKLVHAAWAWAFSKEKPFMNVLALFSAATLTESLGLLVLFILMLLGWSNYFLIMIFMLLQMFLAVTADWNATRVVFGTRKDKAYQMFLAITLILIVLAMLFLRSYISDAISGMIGNMFGYGSYGLF